MSTRSTGLLVRAYSLHVSKHAGHPQSERLLDDWNRPAVLYQVSGGIRVFKHLDRILDVTFLTQSRDGFCEPSAKGLALGYVGNKTASPGRQSLRCSLFSPTARSSWRCPRS